MFSINSSFNIGFETDFSAGDCRIYVTCKAGSHEDAVRLQRLFNERIGGFEVSCEADSRVARVFCQLHAANDVDATEGDRGNTVADAFIRIVHICSLLFPQQARVKASAKETLDAIPFLTDEPHLLRLNELKDYLPTEGSLPVVNAWCGSLETGIPKFELTEAETAPLLEGAYVKLSDAIREDVAKVQALLPVDPPPPTPRTPVERPPRTPETRGSEKRSGILQFFSFLFKPLIRFWNWFIGLFKN